MISDFREIAYRSGGLRAGLYRGFLPYFLIKIVGDTKIEIQPTNSVYDKLSYIRLTLKFLTINVV